MKHLNILFFALGAFLTLQSCGGGTHQQPATSVDTSAAKLAPAPCDVGTSHEIKLIDATKLISNFVISEKGRTFVPKYGVGGYISYASLFQQYGFTEKDNDPIMGMFLYDCLQGDAALFALLKDKNCYKEYRVSYAIDDKKPYKITSHPLKYTSSDVRLEDVSNYLDTMTISRDHLRTIFAPINGETVRRQNNNLVAELGGENYHTSHGYSFFNLTDFERLNPNNSFEGIAIFRAIEYIKEVPYDRIVLIAVNADGTLALDNLILERSWPPRRLKDGTPN